MISAKCFDNPPYVWVELSKRLYLVKTLDPGRRTEAFHVNDAKTLDVFRANRYASCEIFKMSSKSIDLYFFLLHDMHVCIYSVYLSTSTAPLHSSVQGFLSLSFFLQTFLYLLGLPHLVLDFFILYSFFFASIFIIPFQYCSHNIDWLVISLMADRCSAVSHLHE